MSHPTPRAQTARDVAGNIKGYVGEFYSTAKNAQEAKRK